VNDTYDIGVKGTSPEDECDEWASLHLEKEEYITNSSYSPVPDMEEDILSWIYSVVADSGVNAAYYLNVDHVCYPHTCSVTFPPFLNGSWLKQGAVISSCTLRGTLTRDTNYYYYYWH